MAHESAKAETGGSEGMRPRLLDLFCGAGGAAMGYHRAGFEVVGVDINPQPHYPFEFHQADAMTYPLEGFDVIHASPECQEYSITRSLKTHIFSACLPEVRIMLKLSGLPYVIENVPGAPMENYLILCGTMFIVPVKLSRQQYVISIKLQRSLQFPHLCN